MLRRLLALSVLFLLGGCSPLFRWLPVAHGMKAKAIECEIDSGDADYASKAPKGFVPAKENRWVIFIYDPVTAPKVHAAFLEISDDCFMVELPPEKDGKPRHGAVCAHERTPPPPDDSEYAGM